eukprot:Skav227256  [mRNA]  locus=scaffold1245:137425:138576:- [translate_table: standard]
MLCKCKETSWVAREQPPCGKHFEICGTGQSSLICIVPGHSTWATELDWVQSELREVLPEAQFFISKAGSTCCHRSTQGGLKQQDLDAAALHLAEELCKALEGKDKTKELSFIALGTGGLIVRAAVPWLGSEARDRLMTFLSIGTPHLGLPLPPMLSWQSLQLWRLRVPGCPLWLEQLVHRDGRRNLSGSRLQRLCQCDSAFEFFKRVILVGSRDDLVPTWSALVSTSQPKPGTVDPFEKVNSAPGVSRANVLVFAMPFLWLVRCRAWRVLAVIMLLLILIFVWTPPSRALKKKVAQVKDTVHDFMATIQHFQSGAPPHFQETLTTSLTQQLPHERLLRVELHALSGWKWWRVLPSRSPWPQVLDIDTIRCLVRGYGAYLSASL